MLQISCYQAIQVNVNGRLKLLDPMSIDFQDPRFHDGSSCHPWQASLC